MIDTIQHCDALTMFSMLDDESVDLQVHDPPYGIGYKSSCKTTNGGAARKAAVSFGDDVLDTSWVAPAAAKLKPSGALYLFTRWDVLHHWQAALEQAGLKVVQRIVWDKKHWGAGNLEYYGSQTEDMLFAVKPHHRLNWSKREGNVWRLTKMDCINYEGNYDNPTQKPQRLIERIISLSSAPGDLVVDAFVGTGTTAAAAIATGRHYICCDRDEYQYSIAQERLQRAINRALL